MGLKVEVDVVVHVSRWGRLPTDFLRVFPRYPIPLPMPSSENTQEHQKTCQSCRESLPRTSFYKDKTRSDGLMGRCKQCDNAYKNSRRRVGGPDCAAHRVRTKPHARKATKAWWDATKQRCFPEFAEEVREFYKNRPEGYEVDHIIPFHGKDVCGLHVPWNLQYLTPSENRRKAYQFIEAYGPLSVSA